MNRSLLMLLVATPTLAGLGAGVETFNLWEGAPPLSAPLDKPESELPLDKGMHPDIVRVANVSVPTLTVYHPHPSNRTDAAVLICPGGGYYIVAAKHEGSQVAEWLQSIGVTAAMLKYRVPAPAGQPSHARPLIDAQRAMSLLRARAKEWGLAHDRIGVLGFSAGGHLAAMLMCEGQCRAEGYPLRPDEPSCRPDFGILIYPAYLAAPAKNRPQPILREAEKPGPAFFVHAGDDQLGPENSIEFYLALKKAGVPAELHVYQQGGHGFGMLREGRPINDWPKRCQEWLRAQNLIGKTVASSDNPALKNRNAPQAPFQADR